MFDPGLNIGDALDNKTLSNLFQCGTQGGMRRSLKTNSLILISDHVEPLYHDRWEKSGIFHYTGMGLAGDQNINFMQNKTLAQSNINGVSVYLFEKHRDKEYTFAGQIKLVASPYQEEQIDNERKLRKVWIFPLKLASGQGLPLVPEEVIKERYKREQRKAQRLSQEELEQRAKRARNHASIRNSSVSTYERDPYVAEYTKRRANGYCQLCQKLAPFVDN